MSHIPVLLNEVIKFLDPQPGDTILDSTIDGGGHAAEILKRILPDGKLIGIDQDKQLLDDLSSKFKVQNSKLEKNLILINGNFRDIEKLLEPLKIKLLDGALYDLGMSSLQLEESGRGFSFLKNEPLLMTYKFPVEPGDLTAEKILNSWPEKDIAEILFKYGEERFSRRIARNIVKTREKKRFKTTFDLRETIKRSVPYRPWHHIDPATKTFQALRIAVNDELKAFSESLEKIWRYFVPGSRLVIISFHSLEDRIAKNFLRDKERDGEAKIKTPKPVIVSEIELSLNPRSRSAKLRAAIKIFPPCGIPPTFKI